VSWPVQHTTCDAGMWRVAKICPAVGMELQQRGSQTREFTHWNPFEHFMCIQQAGRLQSAAGVVVCGAAGVVVCRAGMASATPTIEVWNLAVGMILGESRVEGKESRSENCCPPRTTQRGANALSLGLSLATTSTNTRRSSGTPELQKY
jgi:hypothetical protein